MTDKLSITVDGKERELLMSYGLLNALTVIVGSPDVAPTIAVNADLREDVLKAVLAERKTSGKILKEVADVDDLEISISDVEKLLDWVMDHVMSFFVRSLDKMVQRVGAHKDGLAALKSSVAGLAG